ncbi:homeobox protein HOX1A [Ananas comosus]|uniref:Homeobox protein HOX1A n=1 Tax=Ananas comosus TaxID=4615 RepID=A0A6P5F728_ANACO|nr:homeobox protein HOX1A [Ananas comosus]XP_020091780.1 homeobox protein HOX1A [Ananas comosus]
MDNAAVPLVNSCSDKSSKHPEQDCKLECAIQESAELGRVNEGKHAKEAELGKKVASGSEKADMSARKNSKKAVRKRKKLSQKIQGRRYPLRSSMDGVRVLRSMLNGKSETHVETPSSSVNPVVKRRAKRGRAKRASNDELSRTRKRIRYLLTRMNYEQNLIDAYSGEGWKGQSLEKIRPEKELERAKSEILRCKLRLRDTFKHLDTLISEGKFDESLFDSEGEISSEDIFCAKCGSKDVSVNNDIILCDGACERGFHQKCLNPPLLTENIPPGDEGWLCPACDCKVDCIDLLNESQGSDLTIEDSWEKVFPEAAAIANGTANYDMSNLPSDDSEDSDYDPSNPKTHSDDDKEEEEESSSADESDFTASSEGSGPSNPNPNKQYDYTGLPSDDSEDDDYDPDCPDPDKDSQKEESNSDESDFTSDSDEFCSEIVKASVGDEVSALPNDKPFDHHGEQRSIMEPELGQGSPLPNPGKRQREHLDYKKLYDEAYGEASSDSSEDEDWSEKSILKKGRKDDGEDSVESPQSTENQKRSRRVKGKQKEDRSDLSAPSRERQYGRVFSQKLVESFEANQYPTREEKESLAQELGLTFRQVSKWFENARHSFKVSGKEPSFTDPANSGAFIIPNQKITSGRGRKVFESNEEIPENSTSYPDTPISSDRGATCETGSNNGIKNDCRSSREFANSSRQKAIARELRKLKSGR